MSPVARIVWVGPHDLFEALDDGFPPDRRVRVLQVDRSVRHFGVVIYMQLSHPANRLAARRGEPELPVRLDEYVMT